jgi:hypothetical protein
VSSELEERRQAGDLLNHIRWFKAEASITEEKAHMTSWHGYHYAWLFEGRAELILIHTNLHAKEGRHG